MKKGYSGAGLTLVTGVPGTSHSGRRMVSKRGNGCYKQAQACLTLYPLTPKVFDFAYTDGFCDGYKMEFLDEPYISPHWCETIFVAMYQALLKKAWDRRCELADRNWGSKLVTFAGSYGYDVRSMFNLTDGLQSSVIHGDPTLSNVMYRDLELCIIDPIMPEGKVPNKWIVDLGKMLQSAIGWEKLIYDWEYDVEKSVNAVLSQEPADVRREAWFWCFIHLLRILNYVRDDSKEHKWAALRARTIYESLRSKELKICYMPSILMAL